MRQAFHDSGRFILSGGMDNSVQLWCLPDLTNIKLDLDYPIVIHWPHFYTSSIHSNYVDSIAFYGDLIISKAAKEVKVVLWQILGFSSENELANSVQRKAPTNHDKRDTRSAFGDGLERILQLSIPLTEPWYMRFGKSWTAGEPPLLAMGNDAARVYLWDLGLLELSNDSGGRLVQNGSSSVTIQNSGNDRATDDQIDELEYQLPKRRKRGRKPRDYSLEISKQSRLDQRRVPRSSLQLNLEPEAVKVVTSSKEIRKSSQSQLSKVDRPIPNSIAKKSVSISPLKQRNENDLTTKNVTVGSAKLGSKVIIQTDLEQQNGGTSSVGNGLQSRNLATVNHYSNLNSSADNVEDLIPSTTDDVEITEVSDSDTTVVIKLRTESRHESQTSSIQEVTDMENGQVEIEATGCVPSSSPSSLVSPSSTPSSSSFLTSFSSRSSSGANAEPADIDVAKRVESSNGVLKIRISRNPHTVLERTNSGNESKTRDAITSVGPTKETAPPPLAVLRLRYSNNSGDPYRSSVLSSISDPFAEIKAHAILEIPKCKKLIRHLAFSPCGEYLVGVGDGGVIAVWRSA